MFGMFPPQWYVKPIPPPQPCTKGQPGVITCGCPTCVNPPTTYPTPAQPSIPTCSQCGEQYPYREPGPAFRCAACQAWDEK